MTTLCSIALPRDSLCPQSTHGTARTCLSDSLVEGLAVAQPGGPCCVPRVGVAVVFSLCLAGQSSAMSQGCPSIAGCGGTSVPWFGGQHSSLHSFLVQNRTVGTLPSGCPAAPVLLQQSPVLAFTCSCCTGAEFPVKQTLIGSSWDANRWQKALSSADVKSCQKELGSALHFQGGGAGWLQEMPHILAGGITASHWCICSSGLPGSLLGSQQGVIS